MLVYGTEAVLPIEKEEPTLRGMLYTEEANYAALRTTLDQGQCIAKYVVA